MTERKGNSKAGLRHKRIEQKQRREIPAAPAPKAKLDVRVMEVTPEQAAKWLEGKCPNRTISDKLAERFARDMKAGSWHLNGETIVFADKNELMDGQHRLWAVVMAGVPVMMTVVFGASHDSMTTYDMGRARTFSDALRIEGLLNTRTAAGAARWWHWYDNVRRGSTIFTGGSATHEELKVAIGEHPLILSAAQLVDASKVTRIANGGMIAFVLTGALERDPDGAKTFLNGLATGENLRVESAVHTLREKMVADRTGSTRLAPMVMCAYTMKAWNYHMLNRPLRHLKWGYESSKPEAFPSFVDR